MKKTNKKTIKHVSYTTAQNLRFLGYDSRTEQVYVNGVAKANDGLAPDRAEVLSAPTFNDVRDWLRESFDTIVYFDLLWERNKEMKLVRRYMWAVAYPDGKGYQSYDMVSDYDKCLEDGVENAIRYLVNMTAIS